jgi:hypothetical protein
MPWAVVKGALLHKGGAIPFAAALGLSLVSPGTLQAAESQRTRWAPVFGQCLMTNVALSFANPHGRHRHIVAPNAEGRVILILRLPQTLHRSSLCIAFWLWL